MLAGDNINVRTAQWEFNEDVARVFDDHVRKSVPLYLEGHDLITKISDFYIHKDSVCYDIGSSTGALARKLAYRHLSKRGVRVVGVEKETGMIKQARDEGNPGNCEFVCADVCEYEFEQASFVTAYYTLQFLRKEARRGIVGKVYDALEEGGAFVLFEKVYAVSARFQGG